MPEPTPAPAPNTPTPPTGNDPKPPEASGTPAPSPKPEDKGEMIPKHRFDEVNTKLAELSKWKQDQEAKAAADQEAKLKEQGKHQELAEQKAKEAEEYKQQLETERLNNRIALEAAKLGIKDLDAATKLIDRSKITIDKDGNITGLIEAVQSLVDSRPYLKEGVPQPNVGSGSNPPEGGDNRTPRFKHSQLLDAKFYEEHKKEIAEAYKLGLIEDDLANK